MTIESSGGDMFIDAPLPDGVYSLLPGDGWRLFGSGESNGSAHFAVRATPCEACEGTGVFDHGAPDDGDRRRCDACKGRGYTWPEGVTEEWRCVCAATELHPGHRADLHDGPPGNLFCNGDTCCWVLVVRIGEGGTP